MEIHHLTLITKIYKKMYKNIYKLPIILEFSIKWIPHPVESLLSLIHFIVFGAIWWEILVIFDVELEPSPLETKSNI